MPAPVDVGVLGYSRHMPAEEVAPPPVPFGASRGSLKRSLLHCADRLAYVSQLVQVDAENGRVTHASRHLAMVMRELAPLLAAAQRHADTAPDDSL